MILLLIMPATSVSKKSTKVKVTKIPVIKEVISDTPETFASETKPEISEVPAPAPIEEKPEEENKSIFEEKVKYLLDYAINLTKTVKTLELELKQLQAVYIKEQKMSKKKKKTKRSNPDRKNGFLGETEISSELTSFLNLNKDTKISRPNVTHLIHGYITEKGLATPGNKSIFVPDEKLRKILGEPAFLLNKKKPELGNGYSYFNLQSYLKKMNHFV